jgi:hypothetical protein
MTRNILWEGVFGMCTAGKTDGESIYTGAGGGFRIAWRIHRLFKRRRSEDDIHVYSTDDSRTAQNKGH